MKAWLDVAVICCQHCRHYFVDASWYVMEMESDIECGYCGMEFNSKKNATDRIMLEFKIDEKGKVQSVNIAEHIGIK
ncbi:MAG: hypothetical protein QXZ25_02675 [Candidatus Bathyarchaeia archaeon]